MKTNVFIISTIVGLFILFACESGQARKERLAREESQQIESGLFKTPGDSNNMELSGDSIPSEDAEDEIIIDPEIYEKYINNSLDTGDTPYSKYFGGNLSCEEDGCSKLIIESPMNSDVLVIIKKGGNVVRHAYLKAGSSYTFTFLNGEYQPFFYFGKGWNPEKEMKNGEIAGGFIVDEYFGKDSRQTFKDETLEYVLAYQKSGNFGIVPSNQNEAF